MANAKSERELNEFVWNNLAHVKPGTLWEWRPGGSAFTDSREPAYSMVISTTVSWEERSQSWYWNVQMLTGEKLGWIQYSLLMLREEYWLREWKQVFTDEVE